MLLVDVEVVALPAPLMSVEPVAEVDPVADVEPVAPVAPVDVEEVYAPVEVDDVVAPVVSVLDEPYRSELLRVPLLQPANPKAREAIAAATVNVILFVFIG